MTKKPARILSIILMIAGIAVAVFGVRLALAGRTSEPAQYDTSVESESGTQSDGSVNADSYDPYSSSEPEESEEPSSDAESEQNAEESSSADEQNQTDAPTDDNDVVEEAAQ